MTTSGLRDGGGELTGHSALVTGASRGIGRAIAIRLAREGADVIVNYREDDRAARETAAAIESQGRLATCVRADVTVAAEVDELLAAAGPGSVDILVNNVGTFALGGIADTPTAEWQQILDSNLTSVHRLCRAALPGMRREGAGRIVNIGLGPMHMVRGAPNIAAYAIAKAGVSILTRSLAIEEAAHGITVNCVAPGLIDNGYLLPEQREWMEKRVPMGRLGTPEEVANAVAFLVSGQAAYVSGAVLSVSGAWDWEDRMTDHDPEVSELFGPGSETAGSTRNYT